ncbi:MAG: potassium-transporting ATPase subunit KdpC [Candidatus Methylumidiphilus sp.]
MYKHLKPAFLMLLIWTVLTGVAYPLAVTGLAQLFLPAQADGSLILDGKGQTQGSRLIGQAFSGPQYFWPRPSATVPYPNNAAASSGSNLGPTNPALLAAVDSRIQALQAADPGNNQPIPVDLITASASGLDPHISPAAAAYQISRVAEARNLDPAKLRALVAQYTETRQWGIFGEPRVNVLALNLALDGGR